LDTKEPWEGRWEDPYPWVPERPAPRVTCREHQFTTCLKCILRNPATTTVTPTTTTTGRWPPTTNRWTTTTSKNNAYDYFPDESDEYEYGAPPEWFFDQEE